MLRLTLRLFSLALAVYSTLWLMDRWASARAVADHNVQRLEVAAELDHVDVLLLGSSYLYSAVDPTHFEGRGVVAYNLGLATASVEFYDVVLEDFLATHDRDPTTVLLNVSFLSGSPAADRWPTYPVHRYLATPLSHTELVARTGHWRQWPELLVRGARRLGPQLMRSSDVAKARAETRRLLGFRPSEQVYSHEVYLKTRVFYADNHRLNFDAERARAFLDLAARLRERGIKVAAFEVPSHRLAEFYSEAYQQAYQRFTVELQRHGFPVLRCPLSFDQTEFRNIDHMNSRGAQRYSAWLAAELDSRGLLRER